VIFGSHIIAVATVASLISNDHTFDQMVIGRMFIDQDTGAMKNCASPLAFHSSGWYILPPGLNTQTTISDVSWGNSSATLQVSRDGGCKYECAINFDTKDSASALCTSKGKS
jgi:hypothetical protein